MSARKPVKVGDVIHLKCANRDEFLDLRGEVKGTSGFEGVTPTERSFVSTHGTPNRVEKSGSWKILSADDKPNGQSLETGDTIYLQSLLRKSEYLDICNFIMDFPPYKAYADDVSWAVYTTDNKDNKQCRWTIWTDGERTPGKPIDEDSVIFLENGIRDKTWLVTHAEVTKDKSFTDFNGQKSLVFGSDNEQKRDESGRWKFVSNASNFMNVKYYMWGLEAGQWVDLGEFQLSRDRQGNLITELDVSAERPGHTLSGTIVYEEAMHFEAVRTKSTFSEYIVGKTENPWRLGARGNLSAIQISSEDGGDTFNGSVTYGDRGPIEVRGLRSTFTPLTDFYNPNLWRRRTSRIGDALDAIERELRELFDMLDVELPRIDSYPEAEERAAFTLIAGIDGQEGTVSIQTKDGKLVAAKQNEVTRETEVRLLSQDAIANSRLEGNASFKRVKGLSGHSESFESVSHPNHYLRQQNFVLKLYPKSTSQLFKDDASFVQTLPVAPLGLVSLQSVNYLDHAISVANDVPLRILKIADMHHDKAKGEATFKLVPGLDGQTDTVSIRASDGHYVVATTDTVKLESEVSEEHCGYASFKMIDGLFGSGVSFESTSDTGRYLAHSSKVIKLREYDDSVAFRDDASFFPIAPLTQDAVLDVVLFQSIRFPDRNLVVSLDGIRLGIQSIRAEDDETRERGHLKRLNISCADVLQVEPSTDWVDYGYQATQLFNLCKLWLTMDKFWTHLSDSVIGTLEEQVEAGMLPSVHLIRECLRRFTIDFEIVQRAIQQRQWAEAESQRGEGNAHASSLVTTDKLTAMAIAPFQHLISDAPQVTPITYFSDKIHIRQVPYTDQFVLVGLTYDLTSSLGSSPDGTNSAPAFDLMAIPHEVGHFMYHNAGLDSVVSERSASGSVHVHQMRVTFADICQQFVDHPYARWCEELFADLYGCVVAGPFTVLGMQALLATGDPTRVLRDDVEHPTPIFRPYFLTEMLRILSDRKPEMYDYVEVSKNLDANWTAILTRWGFATEKAIDGRPERILLPADRDGHFDSFINVDRALNHVRAILVPLSDLLLDEAVFDPWGTGSATDSLSAQIAWCRETESIQRCINEMRELSGLTFARRPMPHASSSEAIFAPAMYDKVKSILKADDEGSVLDLLPEILPRWRDSGPVLSGGSGGTGSHYLSPSVSQAFFSPRFR